MKQIIGLFLVLVIGFVGCGGDEDSSTGPSNEVTKGPDGQTLEVVKEGNFEYQMYRLEENDKPIKHGYYKEYHPDETYKVVGNFIEGKEEGIWIFYDEMGNVIDEDTYLEGSCVENCEWRKTFGKGSGHWVQQTVDGGFIVTGMDGSVDDDVLNLLLLKTDGSGNEQWRKTFRNSWGGSVQQTIDGGFVVTGYYGDLLLLKTDGQGNEQWRKTLEGSEGLSVQQTVDGGFIVTGIDSNSDVFLLKTDGSGNEQWRKTLGEGWGGSVQQTLDEEFVVTGRVDDYRITLLKTGGSGNEQWRKTFGDGMGISVQQTVDGGFVVTGVLGGSGIQRHLYDDDVLLLKTDGQGNEQWRKTFFGGGSGYSVQQTIDGGFVVTGRGYNNYGDNLITLLKTDKLGNI